MEAHADAPTLALEAPSQVIRLAQTPNGALRVKTENGSILYFALGVSGAVRIKTPAGVMGVL